MKFCPKKNQKKKGKEKKKKGSYGLWLLQVTMVGGRF
jgi:hypothetical protein